MRCHPAVSAFLVTFLTCLLATIHFILYGPFVGLLLYRLTGGIASDRGWTRFGDSPFTWTIPLQLPGTLLMGLDDPGSATHMVGLVFLIAASLGAAYSVASILGGWLRGEGFGWSRFGLKELTIVLGMIWIPVPEQWALVYYYTVKY